MFDFHVEIIWGSSEIDGRWNNIVLFHVEVIWGSSEIDGQWNNIVLFQWDNFALIVMAFYLKLCRIIAIYLAQ